MADAMMGVYMDRMILPLVRRWLTDTGQFDRRYVREHICVALYAHLVSHSKDRLTWSVIVAQPPVSTSTSRP